MPNWKKVIVSGSDATLNSLNLTNATAGATVFSIDGTEGRLFSITDELSGSLFAVSDISGIPSFEVFSDDTVKIGTHNSESIVVSGSELKLSHLSTQGSETDVLTINGSDVVGTRQLSSGAFASAYSLPLGTSSARGGFKIGYSESGKNYPVELSSEKMYVNVPWTDTNTDTNTTYLLKATQYESSNNDPYLKLDASSGTDDLVQLRGGGATSVTRDSDGQISITSTDTNTNTQLTTAQVRGKFSGTGINTSTGVITNTNTQLSDAQVRSKFSAGSNVSISDTGVISATDTNTDTNTFRNVTAGGNTLGSTESLDFIAGSNVSISESGGNITISSTDTNTNTTYSAGGGLGLSGTTFAHKDTSTQSSVNNSGDTVIQDVTLDTYGHVTGLTSRTLSIPDSSDIIGEFTAGTGIEITEDGEISSTVTNTNTTYSADGNYGLTLSGTTFRMEDDRRRNSTSTDIYTGNTHDYVFFDASHGMRFYTAGAEDMRLDNSGNLHVDADVVAYSTTISDERLKDNVTTIENPLDKIKALRGVEYDWNSGNRKGKHDLGLIAQEVEKVLPNIVHEHEQPFLNDDEEDETLYKTVDYEKMVAVLIEGIKEQQNQIDSLKSELTEIKGRL